MDRTNWSMRSISRYKSRRTLLRRCETQSKQHSFALFNLAAPHNKEKRRCCHTDINDSATLVLEQRDKDKAERYITRTTDRYRARGATAKLQASQFRALPGSTSKRRPAAKSLSKSLLGKDGGGTRAYSRERKQKRYETKTLPANTAHAIRANGSYFFSTTYSIMYASFGYHPSPC